MRQICADEWDKQPKRKKERKRERERRKKEGKRREITRKEKRKRTRKKKRKRSEREAKNFKRGMRRVCAKQKKNYTAHPARSSLPQRSHVNFLGTPCTFRPIKINGRILSAYLPSYRGGLPEIRSGGMRQRVCAGYKRPMAGQTMSPDIFGYAPSMRRVQKMPMATLVDSRARLEITARQMMSPATSGLSIKNPPPTLLIPGLAERSRQRVQASLQKVRIINFWFCAGAMRRIYICTKNIFLS